MRLDLVANTETINRTKWTAVYKYKERSGSSTSKM